MGRHRQVVTAAPEPDALAELLARCALRDEQALERWQKAMGRLRRPRFTLA